MKKIRQLTKYLLDMNNHGNSTQWPGWQLPLTNDGLGQVNEQQLWTLLLLLLSFVMLGPIFWYEGWAHWGMAPQQDQDERHQGASGQPKRNGRC